MTGTPAASGVKPGYSHFVPLRGTAELRQGRAKGAGGWSESCHLSGQELETTRKSFLPFCLPHSLQCLPSAKSNESLENVIYRISSPELQRTQRRVDSEVIEVGK